MSGGGDGYRQPKPHLLRGDEDRKRAQRKKPKRHERDTAAKMGGRVTPASGAIESIKGDVDGVSVHSFSFLVECKRTEKKSLSVQARWLDKITREAHVQPGREPVMAFQFEHLEEAEEDWIAVPRSVFLRMMSMLGRSAEDLGL